MAEPEQHRRDAEDETKRRFREALAAKKAQAAGNAARADGRGAQPRNAHGPAENRREFRRKSG